MPSGPALACLAHVAERVVVNPYRLGGPLSGKWAGCRSCHVGEYRVIYRVDDKGDEVPTVRVVHVGYRGKVYK